MSIRRQPPAFQTADVSDRVLLSPRMMRVTLSGVTFPTPEPAASCRVLLDPSVMPEWNGNEFLLPSGERPAIRTLTPRFVREDSLDVDVVLHGDSPLTRWARTAATAAVAGFRRGYPVDLAAPGFVLAGDETALPAISQLLSVIPGPVAAYVELAQADARQLDLPIEWLEPGGVLSRIQTLDLAPGTKVWVAGEAAAVQRVRKHLFEERALPRGDAWVRGYWRVGRSESADGPD